MSDEPLVDEICLSPWIEERLGELDVPFHARPRGHTKHRYIVCIVLEHDHCSRRNPIHNTTIQRKLKHDFDIEISRQRCRDLVNELIELGILSAEKSSKPYEYWLRNPYTDESLKPSGTSGLPVPVAPSQTGTSETTPIDSGGTVSSTGDSMGISLTLAVDKLRPTGNLQVQTPNEYLDGSIDALLLGLVFVIGSSIVAGLSPFTAIALLVMAWAWFSVSISAGFVGFLETRSHFLSNSISG